MKRKTKSGGRSGSVHLASTISGLIHVSDEAGPRKKERSERDEKMIMTVTQGICCEEREPKCVRVKAHRKSERAKERASIIAAKLFAHLVERVSVLLRRQALFRRAIVSKCGRKTVGKGRKKNDCGLECAF